MKEEPSNDWHELPSEPLPAPSTAPFHTALGIMLLFWGLISSIVLGLVGLTVLIVSLTRWISEINQPTDHDGR